MDGAEGIKTHRRSPIDLILCALFMPEQEGLETLRPLTADSETWLGFLAKERSLLWALLRQRSRFMGSPKLLVAFGKCFPS